MECLDYFCPACDSNLSATDVNRNSARIIMIDKDQIEHDLFLPRYFDEQSIFMESNGEKIVKQGTSATHIISLVEGMAKIFLEGNHSRNLILNILKPWQIPGSPGIHSDNRHHYSVIAIVYSLVCFIDRKNFNIVLHRNIKFAYAYIEFLSYISVNTLNKITIEWKLSLPINQLK